MFDYTAGAANIGNVDADIMGAEAGVSYKLPFGLKADASAMYAWGKDATNNTPLPQIAPFEGRLGLNYARDDYSVGLLWRAVAKQNRVALGKGNVVGQDLKAAKSFNTLAINGSYRLTDGVSLSVGVDNVLDKTYTEHLNKAGVAGLGYSAGEQFNESGRNYWARMDFKF